MRIVRHGGQIGKVRPGKAQARLNYGLLVFFFESLIRNDQSPGTLANYRKLDQQWPRLVKMSVSTVSGKRFHEK